jgi:hypothetical protein
VVIPYRRFGTTYQSHIQEFGSPRLFDPGPLAAVVSYEEKIYIQGSSNLEYNFSKILLFGH